MMSEAAEKERRKEEIEAFIRNNYARFGASECAARLSKLFDTLITKNVVIGRANRMGLCDPKNIRVRRPRKPQPTVLDLHAELAERVKDARQAGKGPAEIAKEENCAQTVIHRIIAALKAKGVMFPDITKHPPKPRADPAPKPLKSTHAWTTKGVPTKPKLALLLSSAWDVLPGSAPRMLTDPACRGCRWPVGDDGGLQQRFCCEPVGGSGSYCPTHRAVAFRQPTRSEREVPRTVSRQVAFERRAA